MYDSIHFFQFAIILFIPDKKNRGCTGVGCKEAKLAKPAGNFTKSMKTGNFTKSMQSRMKGRSFAELVGRSKKRRMKGADACGCFPGTVAIWVLFLFSQTSYMRWGCPFTKGFLREGI